jgi:maleamate amidohydrolase
VRRQADGRSADNNRKQGDCCQSPCAFFRTELEVFLGCSSIDTLLCCGTSVSDCVRAAVTDAFMRDIRCMVIRDCVADRTTAMLEANLFDLDQKYADVVSLSDMLDYLASLPGQRTISSVQS